MTLICFVGKNQMSFFMVKDNNSTKKASTEFLSYFKPGFCRYKSCQNFDVAIRLVVFTSHKNTHIFVTVPVVEVLVNGPVQ